MRTHSKVIGSVLLLSLLLGLGACRQAIAAAEPGCATPKELLARASAALRAGDREDFAMCFAAYKHFGLDTGRGMADMQLLSQNSEQVVIDGVKKFGAKDFMDALGFEGMMLIYQGPPPFDLLAQKGTMTITGNNATCEYKVNGNGDETLPTQPELKKYMQTMWGDSKSTSVSMPFEKIDNRWFFASPGLKDGTVVGKIHKALTAFIEQVRKNIPACANAKAFKTALAKPVTKLQEDLKAASPKPAKK